MLINECLNQAVSARICFEEVYKPIVGSVINATMTVYSQEQVDAKLTGCTSLDTTLIIGHNYTGDLVLPAGLANLSYGMRNEEIRGPREFRFSSPNLTSVSGPDVVEIWAGEYEGIKLNSSALTSVSFEKLQQVPNIEIWSGTPGVTLNFPALPMIAGRLEIYADFSRYSNLLFPFPGACLIRLSA